MKDLAGNFYMRYNCLSVFTLVVLFIIFFHINNSIPLISDDILYGYVIPEEPRIGSLWGIDINKPILSFNDVFVSQWNHYFRLNGRAPVHVLVQLFSGLWGKTVFSIYSSIFFILFIWYLGKNCNRNVLFKDSIVFLIPFFVFFQLIVQPKCFYSIIATGINYLWSSVVCLMFLYYYSNAKLDSIFSVIGFCLLSFLAGWSHEGIVIPLGITIFIQYVRNRKQFSRAKEMGLFLFFVGAVFLVLAPGNFRRRGSGFSITSVINFIFSLRVFYLYLIIIGFLYMKRGWQGLLKLIGDNAYLNIGLLLSLPVFALLGDGAIRVGYGVDLLSMVLMWRLAVDTVPLSFFRKMGTAVAFLTIAFFVTIQHYQSKASKQLEMAQCAIENSAEDKVVINYNSQDCVPSVLNRFIRTCTTDEVASWIVAVWEMKYKKEIVFRYGKETCFNTSSCI